MEHTSYWSVWIENDLGKWCAIDDGQFTIVKQAIVKLPEICGTIRGHPAKRALSAMRKHGG